jgi:hypothetical protein
MYQFPVIGAMLARILSLVRFDPRRILAPIFLITAGVYADTRGYGAILGLSSEPYGGSLSAGGNGGMS